MTEDAHATLTGTIDSNRNNKQMVSNNGEVL